MRNAHLWGAPSRAQPGKAEETPLSVEGAKHSSPLLPACCSHLNTVPTHCRHSSSRPTSWSQHAFGLGAKLLHVTRRTKCLQGD